MNSSKQLYSGIRKRLIYGFSAIISVFVVSVLVSIYFIHDAKIGAARFLRESIPVYHAIVDLQGEITDVELYLPSLVIYHDNKIRERIDKQLTVIDDFKIKINKQLSSLNAPAITEKWSIASESIEIFKGKIHDLYKIIDSGAQEKALDYYHNDVIPYMMVLNDTINVDVAQNDTKAGIVDSLDDLMIGNMQNIRGQVTMLFVSTLIFLFISMVLSYLIANYTAKSILIPIEYAIAIAKSIAAGDRHVDIIVDRDDETGQLLDSLAVMRASIKSSEEQIKRKSIENQRLFESVVKAANLFSQHASRVSAGELKERLDLAANGIDQDIMIKLGGDLNNMTENLNNVTHDIVSACSSMVSTLDEVRHAMDAQSSGASEQASSINEITASITEIEKSASQTMSKAKDLGGVAEKTRKSGQLGLESVEISVQGMKAVRDKVSLIAQTILDLSRQTHQVGEITAVVNNLAQQSKMLALNASIEAAKAGDAGKGFAIVAAEVKTLAEQSEQSTSQVQKILENIKIAAEKAVMVTEEGTKGVDSGLQMIERTGEIIRNLNEVIREAAIASQQIESAVRQESAGIEQITAGMNEINTVTSAFVESVNQTSDAMDNLSEVTRKLKSSVEIYKI